MGSNSLIDCQTSQQEGRTPTVTRIHNHGLRSPQEGGKESNRL